MSKVAKLVCFSLMTRVIVDEDATDDDIIKACYPRIQAKIDNRELGDNLEEIDDDEECPAGTFDDDIKLEGNYSSVHNFIDSNNLKEKAEELFGENWEAENDVEQIQELAGDGYIVYVPEAKTEREHRLDDYIQVHKIII